MSLGTMFCFVCFGLYIHIISLFPTRIPHDKGQPRYPIFPAPILHQIFSTIATHRRTFFSRLLTAAGSLISGVIDCIIYLISPQFSADLRR